LKENTLLAVVSLPNELFQPYAASTTAALLLEKGVPQEPDRPVFFARIANDGFRLRKGVRVTQVGSQLPALVQAFRHLDSIPGFCEATAKGTHDWAPGAHIQAVPLSDTDFREGVGALIRDKAAFVVRWAPQLTVLQEAVAPGELTPRLYSKTGKSRVVGRSTGTRTTIADLFDVFYGQGELENKDVLGRGKTLVISSSGLDNGAYGFFDFPDLLAPPFVTVPRTGSIGEARVQEFPCGATSDCLLLIPKPNVPIEALYVAAATLRDERWRFDYSRKMTPERIALFPLRLDPDLLAWVRDQREQARLVEAEALRAFLPSPTAMTSEGSL
jgi:hypothetical protein